jgi:hypothetical protein
VSGNWYFDSIADFEARRANQLNIATPVSGDIDSVRAIFTNTLWTFGVQDTWDVLQDLTVAYGFRYDLYESGDRPPLNTAFLQRTGIPNNSTLNGRGIIQPRFSLNWRATDRLRARASAGLFAGGGPAVWISNSFSNPGPLLATTQVLRVPDVGGNPDTFTISGLGLSPAEQNVLGAATLNNVSGGTGIPNELLSVLRLRGAALGVTNALDPDFEIPSQWRVTGTLDWRANLGALGDDWNFGVDVVWSRVKEALTWTDLRTVRNTVQPTLPDGRPRYQPLVAGNNFGDILLTNTSEGYSWNLVGRFNKRWDNGIEIGGAYTWQRARDVNSGTSSVALSNYNNSAANDPNNADFGISNYQRDFSLRLNFGFEREFFGDNATRFDIFFNRVAGQRFSYTMQDSTANRSAVFGTIGTNNRYLLYVPNVASSTADPIVRYASEAAFEALRDIVLNSPLRDYQGQIAPKNIGRSPKFDKMDLRFSQEVPFFLNGKIQLFADVENFLNLLNKDWGSLRQVGFPYYATTVNVACVGTTAINQPCTQYLYSQPRSPVQTLFTSVSLWQIRLGARLSF